MQTITGRLTGEAKTKKTQSGKTVTEFTVVINDSYRPKNQDERVQLSTFYQCSYWGSPKVAGLLKKGTIVTLSGRIGASAWTNREGIAVAALTCTVLKLKILARPVKEHATNNRNDEQQVGNEVVLQASEVQSDEDDLPF